MKKRKTFCVHCKSPLNKKIIRMEKMPIANNYNHKYYEKYPIDVKICQKCYLIQNTTKINNKKIFSNYFYQSKFSTTWLKHCKKLKQDLYKHGLKNGNILEIGCNDLTLGNILRLNKNKYFGVDPAKNIFKENLKFKNKFEKIYCDYFGYKFAKKLKQIDFDIIIGTNVIAHVPNLNDFLKGLSLLMNTKTTAIFEFQYFGNMFKNGLYDTIYHEHYYYHTITSLNKILEKFNLKIFKVKELNIHSGSLRIYIKESKINKSYKNVEKFLKYEKKIGITNFRLLKKFENLAKNHKYRLRKLIKSYLKNNIICAYGAAAKGNTLLNYSNLNSKDIKFIFDENKFKQGKFFPGTDIKIISPKKIFKINPEYILILAWNIQKEIYKKIKKISPKIKFIIPYPDVRILK